MGTSLLTNIILWSVPHSFKFFLDYCLLHLEYVGMQIVTNVASFDVWLPTLSRLAKNRQIWQSFVIQVTDGQSWAVSDYVNITLSRYSWFWALN